MEDCSSGARHLAETGRADKNKLCIDGGSAGGYTTLACLAFTDVFKAGGLRVMGVEPLKQITKGKIRTKEWSPDLQKNGCLSTRNILYSFFKKILNAGLMFAIHSEYYYCLKCFCRIRATNMLYDVSVYFVRCEPLRYRRSVSAGGGNTQVRESLRGSSDCAQHGGGTENLRRQIPDQTSRSDQLPHGIVSGRRGRGRDAARNVLM